MSRYLQVSKISCDFQLLASGGGVHEKKNETEKTESAEDEAWSPRSGARQIGGTGEPAITRNRNGVTDVPSTTLSAGIVIGMNGGDDGTRNIPGV